MMLKALRKTINLQTLSLQTIPTTSKGPNHDIKPRSKRENIKRWRLEGLQRVQTMHTSEEKVAWRNYAPQLLPVPSKPPKLARMSPKASRELGFDHSVILR